MILWIIKKITAVLQDGPKLHWHTKVPQENSIHVFFLKFKKKKDCCWWGAFLNESTTHFEA